jgi:hypothetical protein
MWSSYDLTWFSGADKQEILILKTSPMLPLPLSSLHLQVREGLTIIVKHPMREMQLQIVHDSMRSWNSLDELWSKVTPINTGQSDTHAALGPDASSATASQSGDPLNAQESNSNAAYTKSQFGGMAFGMLVLGALVGVVGLYVAIWRWRPDIHLLPYSRQNK